MEQLRLKNGRFLGKGIRKINQNLSPCKQNSKSFPPIEIHQKEKVVYYTILEGRRVVELGVLATALDEDGCNVCHQPLKLSNTEKECVMGLGSFLYIACESCKFINCVTTGKIIREC